MEHGAPLAGGNSLAAPTLVDGSVRKAWSESTPGVHAWTAHLRAHGVDVPSMGGPDAHGRQVIEWVPGPTAEAAGRLPLDALRRVGGMVRQIHDASESFARSHAHTWLTAIPAPADELICHYDLAPWNLVMGERWVFIDWDAAAPGTRLWDLAYAAQAFTLNDAGLAPAKAASDLAAFVAGYRASGAMCEALPDAMTDRVGTMCDLLARSRREGIEPWASMARDGHLDHWVRAHDYVARHRTLWCEALAGAD